MRVSRLLSFQLMKEVVQYSALSFLALTMVLLTQNGLRLLDELVAVGATLDDCIDVIACLLPLLTAYTLPIAFLFGMIIAVSRMSAEGEILALGASGLGLASLLVPMMILAAVISGVSAYIMIDVEYRAHRELRAVVEILAARGGMLDPGKFRSLVGRTLFVNERDRQNNLRGVMISDRTDPTNAFVIFSERGRFSYDDVRQTFTLGLEEGALHLDADPNVPDRVRTIAFESLDYSFDVSALIPTLTAAVRPRQMTFDELEDVVRRAREGSDLGDLHQRDPIEYELEIHRRYALPVAPMAFALIAVPLGLRRAARTRSRGALISLTLAFAYYGLFSQARFLALDGWVAAHYALWIPNLTFGVIAALLALRVRHVIAD
ncbi:MAG TPA: YjgP/YjgQ family permease [Myxococcales bacterium]|nr:YjgP/YjgQ family permease [Myxococcales bacterium]HIM01013.1 YjgP/YjgQ family permease [Myxococcales bacterium]